MFSVFSREVNWGGKILKIETGKLARQACGSVVVSCGDTVVLATVVARAKATEGVDFLPLGVHYQEKYYSAGKIPGGYIKREAKPSDHEVLVSRLIDRPIRPLFPKNFYHDTQILCTVLSYDNECEADVLSLIGASAAIRIAGLPIEETLGAAKVGLIDGEFVLNPSNTELKSSDLSLMVAGTKNGVLMVESEAKVLSEERMLEAVRFGHESFQEVINIIDDLTKECGKPKWEMPDRGTIGQSLSNEIKDKFGGDITQAYEITDKQERSQRLEEITTTITDNYSSQIADEEHEYNNSLVSSAIKKVESNIVRGKVLETKQRIDGRANNQIRPITCEVNLLPRVHGSGLFTRGETQALVAVTLGTGHDEQMYDSLDSVPGSPNKSNFMLHYNFPAFSVGETGRVGPPGRREVGHGKLAWRALNPIVGELSNFPYVIRLVSEILESNGSSSMATVCGGSMALMAAGVPLHSSVAGIAMGLIKDEDNFVVLSDILGDEDHLGDMDFKVAGTKDGITALQMDIKITSITYEIMEQALNQAHEGRMHILGEMEKAIDTPSQEYSPYAPRMIEYEIPSDKIREVIGPGGSVIKKLCEESSTTIEIVDKDSKTAIAKIAGFSQKDVECAKELIAQTIGELEDGSQHVGVVSSITNFGAFIKLGNNEFLLHISEIAKGRVEKVGDYLKVGDKIRIEVAGKDRMGRMRLRYCDVPQDNVA